MITVLLGRKSGAGETYGREVVGADQSLQLRLNHGERSEPRRLLREKMGRAMWNVIVLLVALALLGAVAPMFFAAIGGVFGSPFWGKEDAPFGSKLAAFGFFLVLTVITGAGCFFAIDLIRMAIKKISME